MGNADATQDPYVPQARVKSALPQWIVSATVHENFTKVEETPLKRACEASSNRDSNVSPVSRLPHPAPPDQPLPTQLWSTESPM
jgi:hypothetical protein